MIETPVRTSGASSKELRTNLARGDALAGTVLPILRHVLGHDAAALFGDEVLARVRAMLSHLAGDLLLAAGRDEAHAERLFEALLATPTLLAHVHAQSLEWALTESLERRCGLDPVISPVMQAAIAEASHPSYPLASRLLVAQTSWCQAHRRMRIALRELPGEVLHAALLAFLAAFPGDPQVEQADASIRADYDEATTRLGLAARLVLQRGDDPQNALELEQTGVALFLTALSLHSGQERDAVTLATHEMQATRLALTLIAGGLAPRSAERQIELLQGRGPLTPDLDLVDADQAGEILRRAQHGV